MTNLNNKIIAITGGSGLLGTDMQTTLKDCGATIISLDIINPNNLSEGLLHCDITNENSVKTAIKLMIDKYQRVDGWINNAYPRTKDWGAPLEELPLESWKNNIDMHLNGYYLCSREILMQMKKQKFGSLINLSSIYGSLGPDFTIYEGTKITNPIGYSAIKGGIVNLSRYLAAYYGKDNVRVNCVSPGGIFDNQDKIFVTNYEKKVPMKRMGTPQDISPTIAFLLSDGASYITGQNIMIDGGWSAI